jgi:hypothetical protein
MKIILSCKGKVNPLQAVEGFRIARGWGSHIFRHSAHRCRQGCQPYAPAAFYPPRKFLVLISVRDWVDPRAILRLEELGKLKKSTSSGNRTRDLPACSIVPQPTTLPRATLSCKRVLETDEEVIENFKNSPRMIDLYGLEQGQVADSYPHGNNSQVNTKGPNNGILLEFGTLSMV